SHHFSCSSTRSSIQVIWRPDPIKDFDTTKPDTNFVLTNRLQLKAKSFVKREVIEVAVRQFMNLESEMMTNLKENVKRLEGICHQSVEKGGQTNTEIDCFIEESGTYLGSAPDNIRFITIPNVTSPHHPDTLPVKYVTADVMVRSAFGVANKRKMPAAAFWSMSASMFTFVYHADTLHPQTYGPGSEEIVDHIPAISPISLADLPWTNQIFHEVALHLKSLSEIAQSLLLSTIYELEPDAIDVILAKVTIPVYVIGQNIPDFQLLRNMQSDESSGCFHHT
ncbi:hypothetical protein Tco_0550927, partial [Tanacetum coccineum]